MSIMHNPAYLGEALRDWLSEVSLIDRRIKTNTEKDGMRTWSENLAMFTCSILVITGCASYGTPESRKMINKNAASYALCERVAVDTSAPYEVRTEWINELQGRGEDCSRFAAAINSAIAIEYQRQNMRLQLFNLSRQFLTPPAAPTYPSNMTCYQQGIYTNCSRW
jgi:hypothetical protein